MQSYANVNRYERHRDHRTSLAVSKTDRKSHSACSSASGSGHLEIIVATEIKNMNRPRSGSWQGGQLELSVDDSTERRSSSQSSTLAPEDVSQSGGGESCGSVSRTTSDCGSSSRSGSLKKGRRRTSRSSPQRRVSSPINTVLTTSPTASISESHTTITRDVETSGHSGRHTQTPGTSSYHFHQQQRPSIASLHPPVIQHVDEYGQSIIKKVVVSSTGSSGSDDSRRHGSSSSPRRNSSPLTSASRAAAAGGRRNSAITYITEVPSSSLMLLQSSAAGKARQSQQPDRIRRSSLQTGMLHTSSTGNELMRPQYVFAKSMEEIVDIDDCDDSDASDNLLAVISRQHVNGCSEDTMTEDARCSVPGSGGIMTRSEWSTLDAATGDLVAEVDVCRVAVYGGQQVGKTTMIDQLLTSEYLANRKDDNNGYRGRCLVPKRCFC